MKKIIFVLSVVTFVSCKHKEISEPINVGNDSIIPVDTLIKPASTSTLITHP